MSKVNKALPGVSPVLSLLMAMYIFTGFGTHNLAYRLISTVYIMFFPGVNLSLILSHDLDLEVDEFVLISIVLSAAVVMFSYQ